LLPASEHRSKDTGEQSIRVRQCSAGPEDCCLRASYQDVVYERCLTEVIREDSDTGAWRRAAAKRLCLGCPARTQCPTVTTSSTVTLMMSMRKTSAPPPLKPVCSSHGCRAIPDLKLALPLFPWVLPGGRRAACGAASPRSRAPTASQAMALRATLDLRASAAPPGGIAGRPWPALHIARRPRAARLSWPDPAFQAVCPAHDSCGEVIEATHGNSSRSD
jgi:hypothetical protein